MIYVQLFRSHWLIFLSNLSHISTSQLVEQLIDKTHPVHTLPSAALKTHIRAHLSAIICSTQQPDNNLRHERIRPNKPSVFALIVSGKPVFRINNTHPTRRLRRFTTLPSSLRWRRRRRRFASRFECVFRRSLDHSTAAIQFQFGIRRGWKWSSFVRPSSSVFSLYREFADHTERSIAIRSSDTFGCSFWCF